MERTITEKTEENQCLSPNIVYPTENRQMKQVEREEVGCTPQRKKSPRTEQLQSGTNSQTCLILAIQPTLMSFLQRI